MWGVDVIHDFDWINQAQSNGRLPESKLKFNFNFTTPPELKAQAFLFGTDKKIQHLRIILPDCNTDEDAHFFVRNKLDNIIKSFEAIISITINSHFQFSPIAIYPSSRKLTTYGPLDNEYQATFHFDFNPVEPDIDYPKIAGGLAAKFLEFDDYCGFLLRIMNHKLELEYRFLECMRLFEWHFDNGHDELSNNADWIALLERFRTEIQPVFASPTQSLDGVMQQARSSAAHGVIAKKHKNSQAQATAQAMITKVFPTAVKMIITIINEHPNNRNLKLQPNLGQ